MAVGLSDDDQYAGCDGGSLYLSGLSEKGTLNAVWGRGSRQRCAITYALNKQNYNARTGLYSQEVVCQ